MQSLTKKVGVLATVIAIAVVIVVGSCLIFSDYALADTNTNSSYDYYYDQISKDPMAEKFYKAFESLADSGEFKKGSVQYDLVANNVVSKEAVEAYVNGKDNDKLVKAYGAGRDAFYMDHPDLFYVDLFSTSINAGMQNGNYVAYLDSSRVVTMYKGESINSETLVNNAIENYNSKINQIVNEANMQGSVKAKIEFVNNYITQHNTYGYGTKVENGRNVDTPKADYIFTSYGAIVNNESVCEGYAKSFKAVMDRLQIPCVCVQGYADGSGKGNYEPHMWNYVQVDGMWYAVDVTYNATSGQNKWMLVGGQTMFDTHVEDGVVSTSGYELRYPATKTYDYGVDSDENGMTVIGSYEDTDNQGKILTVSVSYEGKGARALEKEGKYLAYRYKTSDWTTWVNVIAINNALEYELYPITDYDTKITVGTTVESIQFAIINRPPDAIGDMFTGDSIVSYNNLSESDYIVEPTEPYRNNGFGSYEPAPGAAGVYPSNGGDLPVDKTYEIRITYNKKLDLTEGYTQDTVGMDYVVSRGNDTVKQNAVLENVKWDGDKTVTFTFTPSKMYIHNLATYYFTPVGLVGATSKKAPDPVAYSFKGKSVVCSKVFNDGRLYMSVYGEPNLLDSSDLSVTDFKDENGNYYAESQRSQLILVANKTNAAKTQELDNVLKENTEIKDEEIVSSSTYEINLQICGVVQKVPNGSYMQVSFGFPEGYSADDEGTTFQIYHYKHDDKGNITGVEEIPVIITQYGLIAKVSSFSPFTIVQIKKTSGAVQNSDNKNVYAYVNGGVGGTVTAEGKSGISQVSDDKIVYDITPDNGYAISYVRLNGKVVEPASYRGGKLALVKNDIESSNTLEVAFISDTFAKSYEQKGVKLSYGEKSSLEIEPTVPNPDETPDNNTTKDEGKKSNNTIGIVIGCVVAVVVVAVIVIAVIFVMNKKKKANTAKVATGAKGDAGKSNTIKSTPAQNTASTKSVTSTSKAVSSTAAKPTAENKTTTAAKTQASKSTSATSKPTSTAKSSASAAKKTNAASKPTAAKSSAKPASKSTTPKKK